jgi:RNA polymerase sigma factor (sigma-70 family)
MSAEAALVETLRSDRGRILAALIARLRDFQRAEDALQEATESALSHWGRNGVPDRPVAWLIRVAFRKAIDQIRRARTAADTNAALEVLARDEAADDPEAIPDERLRLIFTCCHPALEAKSRVALTLRTLCGMSTTQVAAVFLDAEPTMGQRLSRAKAKIAAAGIPFEVPGAEHWDERLQSVLTVIYLIFTSGHAAGPVQGLDLAEEATFLARMVLTLRPGEPEVMGLLALLLLTHARRDARQVGGRFVALSDQDRSLWDRPEIAEGLALLDQALALRQPGPNQIKAAIAALHAQARDAQATDWRQIAALYARLLAFEPTDVVRLNFAAALMEAGDAEVALHLVLRLDLDEYQPFHATRAELFRRLGQVEAARLAYQQAIRLSGDAAEQAFLTERLTAIS